LAETSGDAERAAGKPDRTGKASDRRRVTALIARKTAGKGNLRDGEPFAREFPQLQIFRKNGFVSLLADRDRHVDVIVLGDAQGLARRFMIEAADGMGDPAEEACLQGQKSQAAPVSNECWGAGVALFVPGFDLNFFDTTTINAEAFFAQRWFRALMMPRKRWKSGCPWRA